MDGPVGEASGIGEVELRAEVCAVGMYSVDGQVEAFGDLGGGESVADQEEDFAFADGE